MKAAVYVRISSDPQGLRAGVQRQEEDARKLCEAQGWEVAEVYADNDTSAYSGKPRPAYKALCEALEEGKVGAVVAWAWDRLHRSPLELEGFVDLINRTGAQVALCMSGDVDLSTADGRFYARMLGTVARHESEKKSERQRRQKLAAAQAGRWSGGGKRPFGFEEDGETVREAEAAVIREVADRLIAGEGLRAIARDLTSRAVPTSFGGSWNQTTLRQILTSPRIAGLRTHQGAVYKAVWPALVPAETFQLVQAILGTRTASRPSSVRTYLLTGLVFCGGCGKPLTSRGRKGKGGKLERRYVCNSSAGGCGGVAIAAEPLELYVREEVRFHGGGRKAPAGQLAKVQAQLAVFGERLEALDHAHFVEGKFTEGRYAEMRAALEGKIAAGLGALDLPPPAAPTAEGEGLEAKRIRIQAKAKRITVNKATRRGPGLDKGRVEIEWR